MTRRYVPPPTIPGAPTNILDAFPRTDTTRFGFGTMEAVVFDIITNEEHSDYNKSGTLVGRAKIQFLTQVEDSERSFHHAYPLESTIQEYPVPGEVVLIFAIGGTMFYTRKINLLSSVKNTQISNILTKQRVQEKGTTALDPRDLKRTIYGGTSAPPNEEVEFSDVVERRDVVSLKHHTGDVILQSRYGASMRFGSNLAQEGLNQETRVEAIEKPHLGPGDKTVFVSGNPRTVSPLPNIILRTYVDAPIKTVDTPFGLTMEDIDRDANSIYLLTDQVQKFKLATADLKVHAKSVLPKNWPELPEHKWPGAQILINSNRVIINARKERVIIAGNGGVNIMSSTNATIDTNEDFLSWVGRDYGLTVGTDLITHIGNDTSWFTQADYKLAAGREYNASAGRGMILQAGDTFMARAGKDAIISGGRVLLGDHKKVDSFESIALAETLSGFLGSFLMTFIQHSYAVGMMGLVPVPLNPAILAQLVALQTSLTLGPPFASTVVRAQRSL